MTMLGQSYAPESAAAHQSLSAYSSVECISLHTYIQARPITKLSNRMACTASCSMLSTSDISARSTLPACLRAMCQQHSTLRKTLCNCKAWPSMQRQQHNQTEGQPNGCNVRGAVRLRCASRAVAALCWRCWAVRYAARAALNLLPLRCTMACPAPVLTVSAAQQAAARCHQPINE